MTTICRDWFSGTARSARDSGKFEKQKEHAHRSEGEKKQVGGSSRAGVVPAAEPCAHAPPSWEIPRIPSPSTGSHVTQDTYHLGGMAFPSPLWPPFPSRLPGSRKVGGFGQAVSSLVSGQGGL